MSACHVLVLVSEELCVVAGFEISDSPDAELSDSRTNNMQRHAMHKKICI